MLKLRRTTLLACAVAAAPLPALASSSSPAVASPMAGNGHNVTFDGRVFIVSQGPLDATGGWFAMVFRPENVRYAAGGNLDLLQGAFTAPVQVQPSMSVENALAICEASPDTTPYPCDDAGAPAAGPFACYDLQIIDSDALSGPKDLRRRTLKLWLQNPGSPDAAYYKHVWTGGMEPVLNTGNGVMRGIEPTVTRDGKLLVWQGHPANDGQIDILMYATNPTPCASTGWDGPHNISHMHVDPAVVGAYPLAERQLRAADGTPFADGQVVRGAYPWLFPDGDALNFTTTIMPCKAPDNPGGCGARRNTLAVLGYPTNWGIAPIDGGLNPSTTDAVRLFFSSPGRDTFPQLPLTGGADVWPMFGSNTANHADVVFDDGLDGQYGGVWHMNESVNSIGDLDKGRTPDSSGYFNTGIVHGAPFPDANNGIFGKALALDGQTTWVEVPHSDGVAPLNAFSAELWARLDQPVDCDANNNYRLLMAKGNVAGPFAVAIEDGNTILVRVHAGGVERDARALARPLQLGVWTHIGASYDGATGQLRVYIDGVQDGAHDGPPATLDPNTASLTIGGPGGDRPACPNGDGNFPGPIDEVKFSRVVRDLTYYQRPGNVSRFVGQNVPAQVEAGSQFNATFSFRNMGTTAWATAMQHRLGSEAPADNGTWGTGRIDLPGRTNPGQILEIPATLTAPAAVGVYPMQWKLVHDGAEWFGELSTELQIEVVPPGTLTTAGDDTTDTSAGTTSDSGDEYASGDSLTDPDTDGTAGPDTTNASQPTDGPETDAATGPTAATHQPSDPNEDTDEGCACTQTPAPPSALALLTLLALPRRRRR
jgi:MYXO-CTERM domain-containing protein